MSLLNDDIEKLQCIQKVCGSEILLSEMKFAPAPQINLIDTNTHDNLHVETMTTLRPMNSILVTMQWDKDGQAFITMNDDCMDIKHTYALQENTNVSFKNTILYAFLYKNNHNLVRIGIFDAQATENDDDISKQAPLVRVQEIYSLLGFQDKSNLMQLHWAGYKQYCQDITHARLIDFKAEALVFLPEATKEDVTFDSFPWQFNRVQ